jgi:hypothetical protein
MERLMATSRYIDSCYYVSDEVMKACAWEIKQLFETYLKAMSVKDPAAYGEDYDVVTAVIARLNATRRRSNYLHIVVDLEDDEETKEEPQPSVDA